MLDTLQPESREDVQVIVSQADRIASLLERMRTVAQDRLHDAATSTAPAAGIPSSPEEFAAVDE